MDIILDLVFINKVTYIRKRTIDLADNRFMFSHKQFLNSSIRVAERSQEQT